MAHPIQVDVVAADHKVYNGEAVSVVVPGAQGYFGILSGHAPLVASLGIGELEVTSVSGNTEYIALAGGFAEVMPDRVIILAESAEMVRDIDLERARLAVERAEGRLRSSGEGIDLDRARAALLRALNRLRTKERHL